MSLKDYFLISENWSLAWAIVLIILFVGYVIGLRPGFKKQLFMLGACTLTYLTLGSPLQGLLNFGLHSVVMLQQVVILMVVPLFIWAGIPSKNCLKIGRKLPPQYKNALVITIWFIGTLSMWIAHFMSAASLSARSGLAICGIVMAPNTWLTKIPNTLLLLVLLGIGILFLFPVFTKNINFKLKPLNAVIYLFTACVSCSLLGLWVAFSAASTVVTEVAPLLTTLRNPLPLSLKTDQELAGMIMWVPGCVLYVATSAHIALKWLEGEKQTDLNIITHQKESH